MNAPSLRRHGDSVKPQYQQAAGESESWAGKSTDEERPDGNVSGIVRRYKKGLRASDAVDSLGLISRTSDNAIRYSLPAEIGARGLVLTSIVISDVMLVSMLAYFAETAYDKGAFVFVLWGIFGIPVGYMFAFGFLLWAARLELFRPIDEPTIFDRKHRKVYRIFCEAQPGIKGLFQRWPVRACEYDWDLIDAEHNARMTTTGSTIRREHNLVFIVRRSDDDPTIIDSFNIGNGIIVTDKVADATYEHIRRFMEENGPALPPGEVSPDPQPRKGFWAQLRVFTPLSKRYWRWWVTAPHVMVLLHVVFPVTVVAGGLWLFFRWLSLRTSKPIEWPPEVVAAVGPEVAASMSAFNPR